MRPTRAGRMLMRATVPGLWLVKRGCPTFAACYFDLVQLGTNGFAAWLGVRKRFRSEA